MTTASRIAFACITAALAVVCGSAAPAAAEFLTKLIVTVTPNPNQAASGGPVAFTVTIRADGSVKAENVLVTMPMPAGTEFSRCTMVVTEGADSTPCTPGLANGVVTARFGRIAAWKTPRVTLTLTMPTVTAPTPVTLTAHADSNTATDDTNHGTATVLPPAGTVTYLPSGRVGPISCADTLTPESFGTDTTVQLNSNLPCTSGQWGLKITAAGKTLNLNAKKILWNGSAVLGTVGILVSNAVGVTIIGGGLNTVSGIELFDWCVKDEGESKRLSITNLRCFKARTAGIDIVSRNVKINGVKIDRVVGGSATNTAELPGGVGIRSRGDIASIKNNTRVLKAGTVGIWLSGSDTNGDGFVAQIDHSSIEASVGIGLLLEQGPHKVTQLDVKGDGLPVTDVTKPKDGVVVGPTGFGNRLDFVVVKEHGGNGFVINGTGTNLSSSEVEGVLLDGYVVAGSGSDVNNNTVTDARHGFIVSGPATCEPGIVCNLLNTNTVESIDGDAYFVAGAGASLKNNGAEGNGGVAFRIVGDGGSYETNAAENNDSDGFLITGSDNTFKGNTAEHNAGVGFKVTGSGNNFNTNAATINNGAWEWDIGPGQIDGGGNKVNGSTFLIPSGGGKFNKPSGP